MPETASSLPQMMREKAPPGMEHVVRALKKAKGVANPFAVAWKMHRAIHGKKSDEAELTTKGRNKLKKSSFAIPEQRAYPINDLAHARNALDRVAQNGSPAEQARVRKAVYAKYPALKARVAGKESDAMRPLRVLEALEPAKPGEGPRVKVVLVDEGLGNRRNMNFYGPEAIASAVKVFEGKPCHLDHPGEEDEQNRPEGSVKDQAGYFRGLSVQKLKSPESGEMVDACVGELHFDLSECGREAYAKALTALHYQREFPDSPQQYVGLSVLGDGRAEKRTLKVGGKDTEVNYVLELTEGERCDMVTKAGRGGRILDVMVAESDGGSMKAIEKMRKLVESIKSRGDKAPESERKALAAIASDLTAALKEAESEADEAEEMFGKREDESDADHKDRLAGYAKALSDHLKGGKDDGDEPDADDEDGEAEEAEEDEEAEERKESARRTLSADDLERNRIAVKAVMAESGLPEGAYSDGKLDRLARISFAKAKRVIADDARMAESIRKAADGPVAKIGAGNIRESGRAATMNEVFASSFRKED